ncbi:MAG: hypothetical protein MJZ67_06025 [Bacteroidales bacterium]|nr:hypothetical protein [Bacteroidales bacterium]
MRFSRLKTPTHLLPATYYLLPTTTSSLLPPPYYLLPAPYYLLPPTYFLLPYSIIPLFSNSIIPTAYFGDNRENRKKRERCENLI